MAAPRRQQRFERLLGLLEGYQFFYAIFRYDKHPSTLTWLAHKEQLEDEGIRGLHVGISEHPELDPRRERYQPPTVILPYNSLFRKGDGLETSSP